MNKIGYVYLITSTSGKIYCGSTNNIIRRFKRYKRLDCKEQVKLYRSFLKYGVENHIFEEIWRGDLSDSYKYENLTGLYYEVLNKGLNCVLPKYNDKYNCVSEDYKTNMSKSSSGEKNGMFGKHHSEQGIQNIKESLKNRKPHINQSIAVTFSNKTRKFSQTTKDLLSKIKSKPVFQYDLNMNFIKEWKSLKRAGLYYKKSSTGISNAISYNRTAFGFKWSYIKLDKLNKEKGDCGVS